MSITKSELKNTIKSHFGGPMIKVELHDDQLNNAISRARNMHLKWAAGNSTQEVFFTRVISGGELDYDMPAGIIEVIDMNDDSDNLGKANQLFTIQNSMLQAGMLQFINGAGSYSLVNYHMGLNYMDELNRYTTSSFAGRYHPFNNTLTLNPMPSATDGWSTSNTSGMLIRAFMKEGYEVGDEIEDGGYVEYLYSDPWFQEYCIALCKITLGMTRRKFSQGFQSIGNTGIQLDGDQLLQEGKEEKEKLEEQLMDAEQFEGWDIGFA